jgi:hypothetical protein
MRVLLLIIAVLLLRQGRLMAQTTSPLDLVFLVDGAAEQSALYPKELTR